MWKNKEKKLKKLKVKEAKIKIKSTIDFIDVDSVNEYHLTLKKGKTEEIVIGIKITPYSLFLDSHEDQLKRISLLRDAFNKLNFDLWHAYVFNPVNLDKNLLHLYKQAEIEDDIKIKQMLYDDIEKINLFIQSYRELEFFIMIKGKDDKKLEDNYLQLQSAFKHAGFDYKVLNRLDFDNYLSYSLENDLVNDFYFSRGVFEYGN